MKIRIPCYVSSFQCTCTTHEAITKIHETVASQNNNLKIIKLYHTGLQKIILSACTGGYFYYNSFMPIINISISEVDDITHFSILFELKKSTKILTIIFTVLAVLFEITLIMLYMANQLSTSVLLYFPLGLVILIYMFSSIGLFISSKGVLKMLFVALADDNTERIPPIFKSK